jgi:curved DNA-binding protein CbpA
VKDLYKRLGIEPGASTLQIREAISSPVATADTMALAAAEFVLLDPKRRAVYDRTHRVLTTVGGLRSHMGLNFKTFWARGKLRDFTYELAAPEGRGPRRTIRSLRPADIRRAFGLQDREPSSGYEGSRQRLGVIALVLLAITVAAVVVLIYYTMAK